MSTAFALCVKYVVALIYSTYLGGNFYDQGFAVAVDSAGDAYVTGLTCSADFPTRGAVQSSMSTCHDAFVAKIDPAQAGSASLIYSTYLGGNSSDAAYGIAVDTTGAAYVTGYTYSTNFPTLNPVDASPPSPHQKGFVTKLSPAGNSLVYSTYLGGNNNINTGFGIAVDSSGAAYITGYTYSSDFPTVNPLQAFAGYTDVFLTEINPSGSALAFSTYLGGNNYDYGRDVAVGPSGAIYVTGDTCSGNFPTTPNAFQPAIASCYDAFVAKIEFETFLSVGIDIKPGDASNTINLKSGGVVEAAILGSATFDPETVDPESVTLAGAHVATRGRGAPMTSMSDANHDGYPDLVLFFRTQDLQLTPASTEAVLYGDAYSGGRIRGSDAVRIVPAGRLPRSGIVIQGHRALRSY